MSRYIDGHGGTVVEEGPQVCYLCRRRGPTENGICTACLSEAAEFSEADEIALAAEQQGEG